MTGKSLHLLPFSKLLRIFDPGVVMPTFTPGRDGQVSVSSRTMLCRETLSRNESLKTLHQVERYPARDMHTPATVPGGIPSLGSPPESHLGTWPAMAALLPVSRLGAAGEAVCSHEGLGLISNLGCIRAALLVCKW